MENKFQHILMTYSFRSGSALASKILNAHSQIAMSTDKIKFFRYCYNRYLPLNKKNIDQMMNDLDKRLQYRFDMSIDIEKIKKEIIKNKYDQSEIYRVILYEYFKDHKKSIIGEIENLSWTKIPYFLEKIPNSKAMIVLRDPRDVVVSFKKLTIAPDDDYLIAVFNLVDQMNHILKYHSHYPDRFYCIRFEKLKREPEAEVKRITNFLGVKFEKQMLNEQNWYNSTGEKWKNQKVSSFYEEAKSPSKGLLNNPVERWKKIISDEDLFLCEWILSKQMDDLGFKKSGRSFRQETFNIAIKKIMSSDLLRDAFKIWCETGNGVEKYPIDPLDPNSGHQEYLKKFKVAGIKTY